MKSIRARWVTVAVAATALTGLTACSGSSGGSSSPSPGEDEAAGPATIEIWGWAPEGEQLVTAFNEAQDEVVAEYVLQASNVATATNFRNAFEAGSGVPCLVPGFAPLTTTVVSGWAQDITDAVTPSEGLYNSGAVAAAQIDGRYYGLPSGSDGKFLLINRATFDRVGAEVPTTWDEYIALGPAFKAAGVDLTNLAGEDPSTLMALSQQAGAEWFAIDGDEWVVNLLDEPTLEAAEVVQTLIDGDFVSNQTYQDRPALYSYFDSGNMASTMTQWWSITGLKTDLKKSAGDWEAVRLPQFDPSTPVSPGSASPSFVPVGCEHPEAVVAYWDWLTTAEGIEATRNAETGAIAFPNQIPDVSDYVDDVVPADFFNDDAQAAEVVVEAQDMVIGKFEGGPNQDAWFPELQDQWGKAVAGEITVAQALAAVQDFIAADLERQGMSFRIES